jgi:hypothetical protein
MDAIKSNGLALVGAAVGGSIGYALFFWAAKHGYYALILPGGLLGFAAGMFKCKSIAVAVICGLAALTLGFYTEWRFAPFIADESFRYFATHVYEKNPITLIMIAVGGLVGFWGPFRQWSEQSRRTAAAQP